MSWLTGQVLAIEVLSKHCQACKMKQVSDMEEDEYEEWYEGHKDVCDRDPPMPWKWKALKEFGSALWRI